MGKHFNPGNEAFSEIADEDYVDKTGLIRLINASINKSKKLTCISRPRRFGKSFAARMLCAYYDCTCDSHELFDHYEISKSEEYENHINKYNVISLDVTGFISEVKEVNGDMLDVPRMIRAELRADLVKVYPQLAEIPALNDCLLECVKITGKKFVFVIDEWDALIREAKDNRAVQEAYLNFLRGLFKNGDVTPYVVAAAYMTGILPIKKDGSQSAISDFREYSVIKPLDFAEYAGFTEKEVRGICGRCSMNFEQVKMWYDGYSFGNAVSIYNPYSVMLAMETHEVGSYWKNTSASDALETYINMDYEGLQEEIARLIAGERMKVKTDGFQNDLQSFKRKDDVITLMIHLGYLSFDDKTQQIRIPNEEVRREFVKLLEDGGTTRFIHLVRVSNKLLLDTFAQNSSAVAEAIDRIRCTQYAPQYYNDEQALRAVIKYAYFVCIDRYLKVEELPSGAGIADIVYIPRRKTSDPAMIVELKWNKSSAAAIAQIKEKKYPTVIEDYGGDILLIGINYDEKSKRHICEIERIRK